MINVTIQNYHVLMKYTSPMNLTHRRQGKKLTNDQLQICLDGNLTTDHKHYITEINGWWKTNVDSSISNEYHFLHMHMIIGGGH
jgi:hypothetical protein